jgi:hypothetical protein
VLGPWPAGIRNMVAPLPGVCNSAGRSGLHSAVVSIGESTGRYSFSCKSGRIKSGRTRDRCRAISAAAPFSLAQRATTEKSASTFQDGHHTSIGTGGRDRLESLVVFNRNRWSPSLGAPNQAE